MADTLQEARRRLAVAKASLQVARNHMRHTDNKRRYLGPHLALVAEAEAEVARLSNPVSEETP